VKVIRGHVAVGVVIGVTLVVFACRAEEKAVFVDKVPFGLSVFAKDDRTTTVGTANLLIVASAEKDCGPLGTVRVELPNGLDMALGDTLFTVDVNHVRAPKLLQVRATSDGIHRIRRG
jgi:hypothetical protein